MLCFLIIDRKMYLTTNIFNMNIKLGLKYESYIVLCNFYFVECFLLYFLSFDPFYIHLWKILLSFCTSLIVENEIFLFLIFELKNHLLNSWTSVQFTRGAFCGAFKFKFGRRNDSFFSEIVIDFGYHFI